MSRLASMLIFLTIALSLLGAGHYYIWVRWIRDLAWQRDMGRILTWLLISLALSIPATFILSRTLPPVHGRGLLLVAYTWMGLAMALPALLACGDLLQWALRATLELSHGAPLDPARRLTLARGVAAGMLLTTGGLAVTGLRNALGQIGVRQVRIPLARLPKELHGFTIAQLSDVHVGPTLRREFVERIVAQTNALDVDLIAITGDLVDGGVERIAPLLAPLAKLRARHGVFFVTGNHEYYSGVEQWLAYLPQLGIRVLHNERVSIGRGESSFDLVGVDDLHGPQFGKGHGPDLEKAMADRDPTRESVLLAHQPKMVFQAEPYDVGLILSGHTHGGQVWPFRWLVLLQQPVLAGLARFARTWLYVSSGTGYWGPPMRLGAPAEITRLVLLSGAESS